MLSQSYSMHKQTYVLLEGCGVAFAMTLMVIEWCAVASYDLSPQECVCALRDPHMKNFMLEIEHGPGSNRTGLNVTGSQLLWSGEVQCQYQELPNFVMALGTSRNAVSITFIALLPPQ